MKIKLSKSATKSFKVILLLAILVTLLWTNYKFEYHKNFTVQDLENVGVVIGTILCICAIIGIILLAFLWWWISLIEEACNNRDEEEAIEQIIKNK